MRLALAPALLLSPVAVAAEASSERRWVPHFLHEYPLAVCNDGSPGAYYLRPGLPGSRRWLVYLDGAGWCWDDESCKKYWAQQHGTSDAFPKTAAELLPRANKYLSSGLFDPERSPLADAHVAFVKSCSNDAFMGDKPAAIASQVPFEQRQPGSSWHFRGRRIIEAVFADLKKRTGLGERFGDRVVYGGCSAGARGAMVTLDRIAGTPSLVGKAGLIGLMDSGLWVPISPKTSSPGWDSFGYQMRSAMLLANTSDLASQECQEKYPGAERWKCLMGAYRLPFIRSPYFLVHSQYDIFALSMNLWGHYWSSHKLSPEDLLWAETYRKMVVRYLPEPASNSGKVVYSPAAYFHCICTVPDFWRMTADRIGLADSLRHWLTAPETESRRIYEKCEGFDCGSRAKVMVRSLRALPEAEVEEQAEPVRTNRSYASRSPAMWV